MIVLGVDPGTATTGYGVVSLGSTRSVTLLECGVIRTSARQSLPTRIREIYEGVAALVDRFEPSVVSVEQVFHGKNARTALTLGHARGAILLAASMRDVRIAEYSAREIKKAVTGYGAATKDQVAYMVQQQLRLKTAPTPSDAADGVAAALSHCLLGSVAA